VLGGRGALVMVAGIGVNLVLARLLTPADFGYVALGTALAIVGQYLSNGGLGAALIRQPERPDPAQLSAVLGVQLVLAAVFAAIAVGIAAAGGRAGQIIGIIVLSVPLLMLRLPSSISLERDLLFRTIAVVDVMEAAVYYAWALATVAVGFGVWGLATAAIVRSAVGTAAMIRLAPVGFVKPSLEWSLVRPLLAFGLHFQGASAASLARDFGLTAVLGWIGGVAILGVWSFAYRILQIPLLFSRSLLRVSYPAMSRILGGDDNDSTRSLIERTTGVVSAGVAILLVGIAAAAPAGITALAGARWEEAGSLLVWSSLGFMIWIPVSVSATGYLLALGDARRIFFVNVCEAAALLLVSVALYGAVGLDAVGFGWIAVGLVDLILLSPVVRSRAGASIPGQLAPILLLAVVSTCAGLALSMQGSKTVLVALAAATLAEALLVAGMWLFSRETLLRTVGLTRAGLTGVLGWPGEDPDADPGLLGPAALGTPAAGATPVPPKPSAPSSAHRQT
jgi:O-antigen/teichoic acid export membrane protein